MKERKKFSIEEKLKIIQEVKEQGVKTTRDKYRVYPATYYEWKRKLEATGEKGLEWGMTPEHLIPFGSRNASEDAKLFFGQAIQKNRCIALATELFFEEAWAEKSEQNLSRLAGSDVFLLPNGITATSTTTSPRLAKEAGHGLAVPINS